MEIDADAVAPRLGATLRHFTAPIPGGWSKSEGGAVAVYTGAPVPQLNGVWQQLAEPEQAGVEGLLDELAATGVPYTMQLRPRAALRLGRVAEARGMVAAAEVPLMALSDPARLGAAQDVEGLAIEDVQPEEAALHARLVAEAFDAPEEVFLSLLSPSALRMAGVRCYVGRLEGEAVATCLTLNLGGALGVFNVGARPAYRGRGYGSAITARAVLQGLDQGANWAWLQSSPAGLGVYTRLGFHQVEVWPTWVCTS
jgi:GNAT superfamily N-acetyltransferase